MQVRSDIQAVCWIPACAGMTYDVMLQAERVILVLACAGMTLRGLSLLIVHPVPGGSPEWGQGTFARGSLEIEKNRAGTAIQNSYGLTAGSTGAERRVRRGIHHHPLAKAL